MICEIVLGKWIRVREWKRGRGDGKGGKDNRLLILSELHEKHALFIYLPEWCAKLGIISCIPFSGVTACGHQYCG